MRKLRILFSTLSLSVACADVMAQNDPAQIPAYPNNGAVVSTAQVPDYLSISPEIFLKNAIKNPDGSMTIKAGQQTAQVSEMNRRYCAIIGGTDMTNDSDQTIGVDPLYTVVCQGPAAQQPPAIAKLVIRLGTEHRVAPMPGGVHPTNPTSNEGSGMVLNPFGKK